MPKILIISKSCFEVFGCKHLDPYNQKCRHPEFRKEGGFKVNNPKEIPEWCPLPDAEEKDEEA